MSSVEIKIQNHNGLNEISGQDLTVEETIALIDLAKQVVYTANYTPAQIFPPSPILFGGKEDYDEIDAAISKLKDEPISVVSEETKVTPVEAPPITKEGSFKANGLGNSAMNEAMTTAFSEKFGTTASTTKEDESLLTDEERIEELNKDFYETGVKHKIWHGEITPMYRVRWECPKCGDKGNHYAPEGTKQMFCYNCNAALLIRNANGKFPNRDDWGNFFIADELNMKFIRA